jgi:DNA-binding MarR family transcriptional regulator
MMLLSRRGTVGGCEDRRVTRRRGKTNLGLEMTHAAAFRTEVRRFLRRTDSVAGEAGLTSQRYDLLLMIESAGGDRGMRVTELCDLLQMQQTAVTELVKRAEEAGLVRRTSSADDGRVWLLHLTDEGRERLMGAFTGLRGDREALAAALDALDLRLGTGGQ